MAKYRQEWKCIFGAFSQCGALQCLSIYLDILLGAGKTCCVFIRLQVVLVQEDASSASISITVCYMYCTITVCIWYNQTGHSKPSSLWFSLRS